MVDQARAGATAAGREIGYGSRFHVIARDTAAQAWAVADELLAGLDPERVAHTPAPLSCLGVRGPAPCRAAALNDGRTDGLEAYANIWAGYGLVRPSASAALVGSHEQVADRIAELAELGLEHLILLAEPHLEECYNLAEGVIPLLRDRRVLAGSPRWSCPRPEPVGVRALITPWNCSVAGPLAFDIESVVSPHDPDQRLVVYTVEPDSPTARVLPMLTSWAASPAGEHS